MSTLRTRIVVSLSAFLSKVVGSTTNVNAPLPLATASYPATDPAMFDWPSGTGTGQASKGFSVEQSILSGNAASFDLTSLIDGFGDPLSFTKVKAFMLHVVAGPGTVYWHDTFNPLTPSPQADTECKSLAAGSVVCIVRPEGFAVTSVNKAMTFGAVGGNVTVRVQIVGD